MFLVAGRVFRRKTTRTTDSRAIVFRVPFRYRENFDCFARGILDYFLRRSIMRAPSVRGGRDGICEWIFNIF